ncbi:MAG: Uma2 family endonuclease [Hyphomicrobiaceae bacterium]
MPAKLAIADQMTIEEFLTFYESRPDGEKWELIEGVAVMSPSPTDWHQLICSNLVAYLLNHKNNRGTSWLPMLGVGTRVPVSPQSLPEPDVFVKAGPLTGTSVTDDALVLFEVLSKANTKADRAWRKRVYASVPNCQHYVTVSALTAEVMRHDRATGWEEDAVSGLVETLSLPAIGVTIPLRDIYRWTPIE